MEQILLKTELSRMLSLFMSLQSRACPELTQFRTTARLVAHHDF